MSESKTAPKAAAANGKEEAKVKKVKIPGRTVEQIKAMGGKGSMILVTKAAFSLSRLNQYKGLEKQEITEENAGVKSYGLTKLNGRLEKLDETSEKFKAIRAAAKLALPDIQAKKYSDTVKKFIIEVLGIETTFTKGFNTSVLEGISL